MSDIGVSSEVLPYDTHRIGYGVVTDVDIKTSQVKVKILKGDKEYDDKEILNGAFLPIINGIEEVHNRFGSLRKGLFVRLHWTGRLEPKNCLVEIIAGEDSSLLEKDQIDNDLDHSAYKLFSGGMF
jgi:hypothetical protein